MAKALFLIEVTLTQINFLYSETLLQNLIVFSDIKVPLRFYITSITAEEIKIEVTFLV